MPLIAKHNGALERLAEVSNDGDRLVALELPYVAEIDIEGTAALLFHRWSVDSVEAKGKAAKGSAAKKSDDIESYVYRDASGDICLPGEYVRMSMIGASRYQPGPALAGDFRPTFGRFAVMRFEVLQA